MTKVELIAAVANEANLTKKDAEAAVNSTLNAITNALKEGDKVTLVGFGTFEVRERPARKGRNPQTGEEITIDEQMLDEGSTVCPNCGEELEFDLEEDEDEPKA